MIEKTGCETDGSFHSTSIYYSLFSPAALIGSHDRAGVCSGHNEANYRTRSRFYPLPALSASNFLLVSPIRAISTGQVIQYFVGSGVDNRAGNEPSRSLKFHNHGGGP